MNITEATREGDAESNKMVDRDEDYNTRYGGCAGYQLAFKRTKLIPRRADVDRSHGDGPRGGGQHAGEGRGPLRPSVPARLAGGQGSAVLVDFLRGSWERRASTSEKLEPSLRELLYLVLSTPEYQLG